MVFILALGVLTAAVLAGVAAAKPTVIVVENLSVTLDGGFKPKALSKTKPTPIAFEISGKIENLDGLHPQALREFILESDKNVAIDVKGLPTCPSGKLRSQTTVNAEAICRQAIIGRGDVSVGIVFPGEKEIPTMSKIIAFNGGSKGGVTTLFIHAYITIPWPTPIVTTVKIEKIHKGRYGLLSVAMIPEIAGGEGSVTEFGLRIGNRRVLSGKCTDGKLRVHGEGLFANGEGVFTNGPTVQATVSRPCMPKP